MTTVQHDTPPGVPPPKTWHDRINYKLAVWGLTVGGVMAIVTPFTPVAAYVAESFKHDQDRDSILTTADQRITVLEKDKTEREKEFAAVLRDLRETQKDLGRTDGNVDKIEDLQRDMKGQVDRLEGLIEGLGGRKSR